MLCTCISPLALEREAERLRHMSNQARRCRDTVPAGMNREHYADRLERQALAVLALQLKH